MPATNSWRLVSIRTMNARASGTYAGKPSAIGSCEFEADDQTRQSSADHDDVTVHSRNVATHFCWAIAHRAQEPAYFVIARRGKNASARSSSARRRAITDALAPSVGRSRIALPWCSLAPEQCGAREQPKSTGRMRPLVWAP